MITKSIPWNDGTGQYLYLQYASAGAGTTTVTMTSDPLSDATERSRNIDIVTTDGTTGVRLVIKQCVSSAGQYLKLDIGKLDVDKLE